jgi:hypothetical protein
LKAVRMSLSPPHVPIERRQRVVSRAYEALALEGVLVPVTADWNVQLLRSAGFRRVECHWRRFCFAAWIARK